MSLNNQLYDGLKWACLIFVPAVAVLLQGLAELYGWQGIEQHVAMLNLIAVFLGTLLQIASYQFHHNDSNGPYSPV